jgi:hypothetical protein
MRKLLAILSKLSLSIGLMTVVTAAFAGRPLIDPFGEALAIFSILGPAPPTNGGQFAIGAERPRPVARSQTAPAIIPFVDGISSQTTTSSATIFLRQTDGTNVSLQTAPTPPYTVLTPTSELMQVFSSGLNVLLSAPSALAGTGIQSQPTALSTVLQNGQVAYAAVAGNDSAITIHQTAAQRG